MTRPAWDTPAVRQHESKAHLSAAIRELGSARYHLGNDHPAYDAIGNLIAAAYEAERAFE